MNTLRSAMLAALFCSVSGAEASNHVFRHEHVLGTSLEIRVDCASPETAAAVEACALSTIDRLDRTLSRHNPASSFNRWQQGDHSAETASTDLTAVLDQAESWRVRSSGVFDIRAEAFARLWSEAADRNQIPDAASRQRLLSTLNGPAHRHTERGVVPTGAAALTLDGLAKGYIIDAVCSQIADQFPKIDSFTINIGGDLRKVGLQPLNVSVADPVDPSENAAPLVSFMAQNACAIATSGGYRRFFEIQGRQFSHIIDPRTGFPQSEVISASVIAPTAVEADAAATTLAVMTPSEGLALIESLEGYECLILPAESSLVMSSGWPKSEVSRPVQTDGRVRYMAAVGEKSGLYVDFILNRPKGQRYRRPYVAVWLEDLDGFPVKTVVLWMQTEQPGPRWHRDLTRWYRNDRMRLVVESQKLIGTISGATRGPGEYQARFDGTDNSGKPLPEGKYTLCLEVAREHGTYQIIRHRLELGEEPLNATKLKGNIEISEVSCRYLPWVMPADETVQ